MSDRAERVIGPWLIIGLLGKGGNASVYEAVRNGSDDPPVALKVLRSKKIESEPYHRFTQEIDFLRGHGEEPGILPILDAELPDAPNSRRPAWLAMPKAISIATLAVEMSVEEIVLVVRTFAMTLTRLKADYGIAHRDIKPLEQSAPFAAQPTKGPQVPHLREELYFVASGTGRYRVQDQVTAVASGDVLFAAAHVPHGFEDISEDFTVWVLFYGPEK
jgi:mannose-6-phosphate isomerase-like protein (cupin superfamily)